MLPPAIEIAGRKIGPNRPAYIIAEISANHHHRIEEAIELIDLAKASGADAVKIQTYTPDTMTIQCDRESFRIGSGTVWEGQNLYELYAQAYTPWEWHESLFKHAAARGITLFSTPFDDTAVDLLEKLNAPAYKIASFELVHLPLIKRIAQTGKPIIISTGMGSLEEIEEAVAQARDGGAKEIALLKCTSAYPAPPDEANLRRIADMATRFNLPTGLSDHTMSPIVALASLGVGACIIEKHFTRSRSVEGPDSAFSLEPSEFRDLVENVRLAERALGQVTYERTSKETASMVFRRSIFAVDDIPAGAPLTKENIRIIRPGYGLAPKHYPDLLNRQAKVSIARGTPLCWEHLSEL